MQANYKEKNNSCNSITRKSNDSLSRNLCSDCRSSVTMSDKDPMTSSDGISSETFDIYGLNSIRQRRMALTSDQIGEVQTLLTKIQTQINEENWARKCQLRSKENSSESISEGVRILSSIMEHITSNSQDSTYLEEKTNELGVIRAELEALAINADLLKPDNMVRRGKILGCIKRKQKISRQELLKEQSIEFVKKMTLAKNDITKKQILVDDISRRNDELKRKCSELEETLKREHVRKDSLESYVGRCEQLEEEVKSREHEQVSILIGERNGLVMLSEANRKEISDLEICLGCEVDMRSKAELKLSVCKGENEILTNRINELKRQLETIKREQESVYKDREDKEKALEEARNNYIILQNELVAQKKRGEEADKERMKMIGELTEDYHTEKRKQNQRFIEVSEELAISQQQVSEIKLSMSKLELSYSKEKQTNKLETESLHKTLSDAHSRLESENTLIEHHKHILEQIQKRLENKDLECASLEEKNKAMHAVIEKLSLGTENRTEGNAVLEEKLEKYKKENEELKKENQELLEVHVLEMADIKSKYIKTQEQMEEMLSRQVLEETPCVVAIDSSSQNHIDINLQEEVGCGQDQEQKIAQKDCILDSAAVQEELAIHAKAWQIMLQLQSNIFRMTAQGDIPLVESEHSGRTISKEIGTQTQQLEETPCTVASDNSTQTDTEIHLQEIGCGQKEVQKMVQNDNCAESVSKEEFAIHTQAWKIMLQLQSNVFKMTTQGDNMPLDGTERSGRTTSHEIGIQTQAIEETPCKVASDNSTQTGTDIDLQKDITHGQEMVQYDNCSDNAMKEELAIHAEAWKIMLQLQSNVFKMTTQGDTLPLVGTENSGRTTSHEIGIQTQALEEKPCTVASDNSTQTGTDIDLQKNVTQGQEMVQYDNSADNARKEELAIHAKAWQIMLQLQCYVFKMARLDDMTFVKAGNRSRRQSVSFAVESSEENVSPTAEQGVSVSASDDDEWDFEVVENNLQVKTKEDMIPKPKGNTDSDETESVSFSSDEFDWEIEDAATKQKKYIVKQRSCSFDVTSPGTSKETVFTDISQVKSEHFNEKGDKTSTYAIKQGRSVRSTGDISFNMVESTTSHPHAITITENVSDEEEIEHIVQRVDANALSVNSQCNSEDVGIATDIIESPKIVEGKEVNTQTKDDCHNANEREIISTVDTGTDMNNSTTIGVKCIEVKEVEMQTEDQNIDELVKGKSDMKEFAGQSSDFEKGQKPSTADMGTGTDSPIVQEHIDVHEIETQTYVDLTYRTVKLDTDTKEIALQADCHGDADVANIVTLDVGTETHFDYIKTKNTEMQTEATVTETCDVLAETKSVTMQISMVDTKTETGSQVIPEQVSTTEFGVQTEMADVVQNHWTPEQSDDGQSTSKVQLTEDGAINQSVTNSNARKESILQTEVKSLRVSLGQALEDLNNQEQFNTALAHQLATYNKEYLIDKSNVVIERRNECMQLNNELKLAQDEILYLKTKIVAKESDKQVDITQQQNNENETKGLDSKDTAIKYLQQEIQTLRIKLFEHDESMKIYHKDQADLEKKHNRLLTEFVKLEEDHELNLSTGTQLAKIIKDQKRIIAEKEKDLDDHEKCLQNAGRIMENLAAANALRR